MKITSQLKAGGLCLCRKNVGLLYKSHAFKIEPGRYNLAGIYNIQSSIERLLSSLFLLHELGWFKMAIKSRKDNEMTKFFAIILTQRNFETVNKRRS